MAQNLLRAKNLMQFSLEHPVCILFTPLYYSWFCITNGLCLLQLSPNAILASQSNPWLTWNTRQLNVLVHEELGLNASSHFTVVGDYEMSV